MPTLTDKKKQRVAGLQSTSTAKKAGTKPTMCCGGAPSASTQAMVKSKLKSNAHASSKTTPIMDDVKRAYADRAVPTESSQVCVIWSTQLKLITSFLQPPEVIGLSTSGHKSNKVSGSDSEKNPPKRPKHSSKSTNKSKKGRKYARKSDKASHNESKLERSLAKKLSGLKCCKISSHEEEDDHLEQEQPESMEVTGQSDNIIVEDVTPILKKKKKNAAKESKVLLSHFEEIDGSLELLTLGKWVYHRAVCIVNMFPGNNKL
ncbi:hypothetical protein BT96DRAFT_1003615 [Gymnopus androsaceus JB14]|uniref:Uncharacterized protein n=1 Tax=Gymnopus androsaceus JB14 TaxID=1447944 RepID=A0A6A4GTJ7_9AGAR|nr:hypothetical protein BT96DRAFT_1003615 [Gymnopus androsaceus JB14]